MTAELLWEVVGWIGAFALLFGYGLITRGRVTSRSASYVALNLVGSAGLALNGIVHDAWPSAALNLLWLAIGLTALLRPPVPVRADPAPADDQA